MRVSRACKSGKLYVCGILAALLSLIELLVRIDVPPSMEAADAGMCPMEWMRQYELAKALRRHLYACEEEIRVYSARIDELNRQHEYQDLATWSPEAQAYWRECEAGYLYLFAEWFRAREQFNKLITQLEAAFTSLPTGSELDVAFPASFELEPHSDIRVASGVLAFQR